MANVDHLRANGRGEGLWNPSFEGERKGRGLRMCHLRATGQSRQTGSQAQTQQARKDGRRQASKEPGKDAGNEAWLTSIIKG